MINDMAPGLGQADLTLNYKLHNRNEAQSGLSKSLYQSTKLTLRDFQVGFAELIGTFFLTLIIGCTKITLAPGVAPFAIGLGLVAIVYTTGPISGGMVNPAVTIGLVVRGKLSKFEAVYCITSQLIGAALGSLMSLGLYSEWKDIGYPHVADPNRRGQAFVAEMLQTFALVSVVLCTATTTAQANNSYFGVAIGFVVLSGALVIGGVSGGCFNPAVAMLTLFNGDVNDLWVFIFGPICGAFGAGLMFRLTNPGEFDSSDAVLKLAGGHFNPDGNITRMIAMLVQEFIGTFYLAWTVALTGNVSNTSAFIAVGAILTSMVYAGGAISGGHYNPAVSMAVYFRSINTSPSRMRPIDCGLYMSVQVFAVFMAGLVAAFVNGGLKDIASPAISSNHTTTQAFFAEFFFTFLLILSVLSTATFNKVKGNSFFGLAIGFAVIGGAISVGDISGGVLNPAIGFALPLITGNKPSDIWVYIISEFCASIFAAIVFRILIVNNPDEDINSMNDKSNELSNPILQNGEA
eukprot:gene11084-14879_t